MKNSIVVIGIALVSVIQICNAANVVDKQNHFFQTGISYENNISNGKQTFKFNCANRDSINLETIESVNTNKLEKTSDELLAEDNAITENNISNETQPLDFEIINKNAINYDVIESASSCKIEKTPEEIIAEDNAITGNNLSNETQVLDFYVINSKLLLAKR